MKHTGTAKKRLKRRNINRLHYPGFYSTIHSGGVQQTTWVEYRKTSVSSSSTSCTRTASEQQSVSGEPGLDAAQSHDPTAAPGRLAASYYDRKAKVVEEWSAVRTQLLDLAAVTEVPPTDPRCSLCGEMVADPVRCIDCGPKVVWCASCAVQDHCVRPYHIMEQWTGSMFTVFKEDVMPTLKTSHLCSTKKMHPLMIVTNQGKLKHCQVELCSCKTAAEILMEFHLWPSSVKSPRMAFALTFMHQLEYLLLEARVSLQSFCQTMRWKNGLSLSQQNTIYRMLINESFEEFRHFSFQVRTVRHICPESDDGTICPACPQINDESSPVTIAIDGNFGLVHKRSSGRSLEPPKHQQRYFLSSQEVQDAVSTSDNDSKIGDGECSSFQAGEKVRAKVKSKKLDVTGIFGGICKHEVPLLFLDMEHGERLAYPLILVRKILESKTLHGNTLHLMYDIACMFDRYLQNRVNDGAELKEKIKLAIPIFHCYGHQVSCQMKYSPRRQTGFGTADGETTERLWSYARPFSPILKEMTPSHRTDLLTDMFLHYGYRKKESMDMALVDRLRNALKGKAACQEELQKLLQGYGVIVSSTLFESWEKSEAGMFTAQKAKTYKPSSWQELYVADLRKCEVLQLEVQTSDDFHTESNINKLSQLQEVQTRLKKTEKKHKIKTRWLKDDELYITCMAALECKQRDAILNQLLQLSRERRFLLGLKSKYADGQALATRICRQINVVSSKVKRTVKVLNSFSTTSEMATVTESDALDPTSLVYESLQVQMDPCEVHVPSTVQRQAIDLWHRGQRCEEEVDLVKTEMYRLCQYYLKQQALLYTGLAQCRQQDNQSATLVFMRLFKLESRYRQVVRVFSGHIEDIPRMKYVVSDCADDPTVTDSDNSDDEHDEEDVFLESAGNLSSESADSDC